MISDTTTGIHVLEMIGFLIFETRPLERTRLAYNNKHQAAFMASNDARSIASTNVISTVVENRAESP